MVPIQTRRADEAAVDYDDVPMIKRVRLAWRPRPGHTNIRGSLFLDVIALGPVSDWQLAASRVTLPFHIISLRDESNWAR